MTSATQNISPPLPRWVILVGSGLIAFHFFAVGILVLAAPSGPWLTNFGSSPALGPSFADSINSITGRRYLAALYMTHPYHFNSNAPESPSITFEVNLKDDKGNPLKTLKFPDENANYWLNHRQRNLAESLGNDQPVQARPQENILPPGQLFNTVSIWLPAEGGGPLRLTKVSELRLPKDRPVSRPAKWSVVLAQAYVRHLCRLHGAASGELIRHHRNAVMPMVLFMADALPLETFAQTDCSYGEYKP